MLLQEGEDYIEIEAVDRVPEGLPTAGDTELSVEVCSSGFRGQASAWIEVKRLSSFLIELTELEKHRQGSATLTGYGLPRNCEFVLRVWSVDRKGHMAIGGRLTKQVYHEAGRYDHAVEFGFEFDPTLLPKLVSGFRAIAEGRLSKDQ